MRIRDCRIFIRHINADIAISVQLKQKDKKKAYWMNFKMITMTQAAGTSDFQLRFQI